MVAGETKHLNSLLVKQFLFFLLSPISDKISSFFLLEIGKKEVNPQLIKYFKMVLMIGLVYFRGGKVVISIEKCMTVHWMRIYNFSVIILPYNILLFYYKSIKLTTIIILTYYLYITLIVY